jgi:hypothetical protein
MRRYAIGWCLGLALLQLTAVPPASASEGQKGEFAELPAEILWDKIRGGLLGQMLGNLNGIKHEMRYIDEPGNVAAYTPYQFWLVPRLGGWLTEQHIENGHDGRKCNGHKAWVGRAGELCGQDSL